jgi:hypothetical protein
LAFLDLLQGKSEKNLSRYQPINNESAPTKQTSKDSRLNVNELSQSPTSRYKKFNEGERQQNKKGNNISNMSNISNILQNFASNQNLQNLQNLTQNNNIFHTSYLQQNSQSSNSNNNSNNQVHEDVDMDFLYNIMNQNNENNMIQEYIEHFNEGKSENLIQNNENLKIESSNTCNNINVEFPHKKPKTPRSKIQNKSPKEGEGEILRDGNLNNMNNSKSDNSNTNSKDSKDSKDSPGNNSIFFNSSNSVNQNDNFNNTNFFNNINATKQLDKNTINILKYNLLNKNGDSGQNLMGNKNLSNLLDSLGGNLGAGCINNMTNLGNINNINNLSSLPNLENLGNISNLNNLGNLSNLNNLNLTNLGNMNNLNLNNFSNMSSLNNLGSLNNLNNLNNLTNQGVNMNKSSNIIPNNSNSPTENLSNIEVENLYLKSFILNKLNNILSNTNINEKLVLYNLIANANSNNTHSSNSTDPFFNLTGLYGILNNVNFSSGLSSLEKHFQKEVIKFTIENFCKFLKSNGYAIVKNGHGEKKIYKNENHHSHNSHNSSHQHQNNFSVENCESNNNLNRVQIPLSYKNGLLTQNDPMEALELNENENN